MNRYKSSQRWSKIETGVYMSPCGRFRALKEARCRWRLVAPDGAQTLGPFTALADCQEIAERYRQSVLP